MKEKAIKILQDFVSKEYESNELLDLENLAKIPIMYTEIETENDILEIQVYVDLVSEFVENGLLVGGE